MNLSSAQQVKSILARYGLRPNKRLGQNFLIDRNVLDRIVAASGAGPGVGILEIGPGLGTVTRELAAAGASVVCVEIDTGLAAVLEETLAAAPGVEVVTADFLKLDIPKLLAGRGVDRWVAVGNLPYYITSPIISRLLEARALFSTAVLMVQREFADRLQAEPGASDYGALTVFAAYHCEVESVMRVSRNAFYPVPEVNSELLRLTMRGRPAVDVSDEALFFSIVRAAFGKRRKTLANALSSSSGLGWDKQRARRTLHDAGIDGERRGETLSIEEFARLAEAAVRSSDCADHRG